MTRTRTSSCTRSFVLCAFLLSAACGTAEPDGVAFAPASHEVEITPAERILGSIDLAEIEIRALPSDDVFVEEPGAAIAAAAPAAKPEPAKAWAAEISATREADKESRHAELAAVDTEIPSELGAMGGFDPDFAPVRKSFASRGKASGGDGDAIASLDSGAESAKSFALKGGRSEKQAVQRRKELGAEDIRRSVHQQMPRVRACYERVLKGEENLRGRLVMAFSIEPDGSVSSAKVANYELGSDKVARCVTHAVGAFRFPEGTEAVAVEYPMVFEPGNRY